MSTFVHLHVHSDASDGIGTPERIVERAKALGQPAVALTDHGTLANMVAFHSAAKRHGIKPLLGQEIYLLDYEATTPKSRHMTVLAQNLEGLHNLYALTTLASKSPFKLPTVTLNDLFSHNKGLIVLSGCTASPIYHREGSALHTYVGAFVDVFKERFILEVTLVPPFDTMTRIQGLHKRFGSLIVPTCDAHYILPDEKATQAAANMARRGFSYENAELWMKPDTMIHKLIERMGGRGDGLIHNTGVVASMIDEFSISSPTVGLVYPNAAFELTAIIKNKLRDGIGLFSPDEMRIRIARAKSELEVIISKGYADYFMIVYDIVNWAKRNGIPVGPGRGSAAGSFVLFLLGVTHLDPLAWGLSFERFLNPKRPDMPDVDIDFGMVGRQEVLSYISERWGGVQIATYSRYSHKMLVHDLAKQLGISREDEIRAADDPGSPEFLEAMATSAFASSYNTLAGTIRHRGKHASGIVISDSPMPLERMGDNLGVPWTEGDSKELSAMGLVKFDILGLTALTAIRRMEDLSGQTAPSDFIADQKVLKLFRNGDLLGIFQFTGSPGIVDLTKKICPTTPEDLIAINALWRPGALDVGSTRLYASWKASPRKLHPQIDPLLANTYGAIVYQEQVMAVFAEVSGGDVADADLARRVIVKSKVGDPEWEKKVLSIHESFMTNGVARGFDTPLLDKLWHELIAHARYSFNRAHAASYAFIAYQMAFFKTYHPLAFYAAMLEFDNDNTAAYLYEALGKGISISPPHINISTESYSLDVAAARITMPLSAIDGLGPSGVTRIIQTREDNGPFTSFTDFITRVSARSCNARARKNLMLAGAFSGVDGDPSIIGFESSSELTPGSREAQKAAMKFVAPLPRLVRKVAAIREHIATSGDKFKVAGVVVDIRKKKRDDGEIWFVDLYPDGFFWVKAKPKLVKGDVIVATLKGRRAVKIEAIE